MTNETKPTAKSARATKKRAARAKRSVKATRKAEPKKAKDVAVLRNLDAIAKEINVRLEKAQEAETQAQTILGKAEDHKLAAALKLSEAKGECKKARIAFKGWVEENVKVGYNYAVQLARIGGKADPVEALGHARESGRQAAKRHREKRQNIITPKSNDTPKAKAEPKKGKLQQAEEALAALGDRAAQNLVEDRLAKQGLAVVTKDEAKKAALADLPKSGRMDLSGLKDAFKALPTTDRHKFLKWAADLVGVDLQKPNGKSDDPTAIPATFKRSKGDKEQATA